MFLFTLFNLGHIQAEDVVGNSFRRGGASVASHGIIRIDEFDIIGVAGGRVFGIAGKRCLIGHNHLGISINFNRLAGFIFHGLKVGKGNGEIFLLSSAVSL